MRLQSERVPFRGVPRETSYITRAMCGSNEDNITGGGGVSSLGARLAPGSQKKHRAKLGPSNQSPTSIEQPDSTAWELAVWAEPPHWPTRRAPAKVQSRGAVANDRR